MEEDLNSLEASGLSSSGCCWLACFHTPSFGALFSRRFRWKGGGGRGGLFPLGIAGDNSSVISQPTCFTPEIKVAHVIQLPFVHLLSAQKRRTTKTHAYNGRRQSRHAYPDILRPSVRPMKDQRPEYSRIGGRGLPSFLQQQHPTGSELSEILQAYLISGWNG